MRRQALLPCFCLQLYVMMTVANAVSSQPGGAKDIWLGHKGKPQAHSVVEDTSPTHTDKSQTNRPTQLSQLYPRPAELRTTSDEKRQRQERDNSRYMVSNIGESRLVSCAHVTLYDAHRWLIQVTKCPSAWPNATVRKSCEMWDRIRGKTYFDDITMLPVQDQIGIVYANVYCAVCNHVRRDEMNAWESILDCTNLSVLDEASMSPENLAKNCKRSVSPWQQDAILDCKPGRVDKSAYLRRGRQHTSTLWDSDSFPVSFNMLMNFDFTGNTHLIFSARQQIVQSDDGQMCQDSETYDTYSERCRPVTCSTSHRLQNGRCVATGHSTRPRAWTTDDIDDLLLVEDVVIVTLTVNITLGDYLLFFRDEPESELAQEIATQLSEHLNISSSRMSHFNISFEFGAMNGSVVQVSKVTNEQYQQLTSHGEANGNLNVIGGTDSDVSGEGHPGAIGKNDSGVIQDLIQDGGSDVIKEKDYDVKEDFKDEADLIQDGGSNVIKEKDFDVKEDFKDEADLIQDGGSDVIKEKDYDVKEDFKDEADLIQDSGSDVIKEKDYDVKEDFKDEADLIQDGGSDVIKEKDYEVKEDFKDEADLIQDGGSDVIKEKDYDVKEDFKDEADLIQDGGSDVIKEKDYDVKEDFKDEADLIQNGGSDVIKEKDYDVEEDFKDEADLIQDGGSDVIKEKDFDVKEDFKDEADLIQDGGSDVIKEKDYDVKEDFKDEADLIQDGGYDVTKEKDYDVKEDFKDEADLIQDGGSDVTKEKDYDAKEDLKDETDHAKPFNRTGGKPERLKGTKGTTEKWSPTNGHIHESKPSAGLTPPSDLTGQRKRSTQLTSGQQEVSHLASEAGKLLTEAVEPITEAEERIREDGERMTEAGDYKKDAGERITEAGELMTEAGERMTEAEAGDYKKDAGDHMTEAGEHMTVAGDYKKDAGELIMEAGKRVTEAGERMTEAGERMTEAGERMTEARDYTKEAGERMTEDGEHSTKAGKQSTEIGADKKGVNSPPALSLTPPEGTPELVGKKKQRSDQIHNINVLDTVVTEQANEKGLERKRSLGQGRHMAGDNFHVPSKNEKPNPVKANAKPSSKNKTKPPKNKTRPPKNKTRPPKNKTRPPKNKLKEEKPGSWRRLENADSDKVNDLFANVDPTLTDKSASPSHEPRDARHVDSFGTGRVMSANGDFEVYLSAPVNEEDDRLVMRSTSPDAVNDPMVMKISFLLVPSRNPNAEKSRTLAQKITDLVIERELRLKLSGKNITVVDSTKNSDADDDYGEAFCRWGQKYQVKDDEFSFVTKDNTTLLYENKTGTYNRIGQFDLWVFAKGNNVADEMNLTIFQQYAFLCLMPQIKRNDCRRIQLMTDEYRIIERNKSLVFEEREYDIYSYEVVNQTTGSMAICVPQSYDVYEHTNVIAFENICGSEFLDVLRADGYLTLILGRLSVAALTLVLITYCLFKKLRNLPGCNTMSLTLALLIAQIVLTEGMAASPPWLCSLVAVTEHFTRLAAQFWMSVISFDVYRTFSKPVVSRATHFSENRKRYFKYSLYAWGVPLLIVGICVLIDFSDLFPDAYIGYGGKNGISRMSTAFDANSTGGALDDVVHVRQSNDADVQNETVSPLDDSNPAKTMNLPYMANTCLIGNSLANLVAFGAPIFIILIVNCVLFIRTIMNISQTSKFNKRSLSQRRSDSSLTTVTGKSDVMLYIRMSTVMGLTWVFGFIWSMISSFATVYTKTVCIVVLTPGILSTIFNTSQGIFIFMAFVCNRRVFSLYRVLLARLRKSLPTTMPKARLYSVASSTSTTSATTQSSHVTKY